MGDGGAVARGPVAGACGAGDSAAVANFGRPRIDPGSLRSFAKHIGLLPGKNSSNLPPPSNSPATEPVPSRISTASPPSPPLASSRSSTSPSRVTSSFIANGLVVHNCSEYMFLDNTACNLASLNVLTFFDAETAPFRHRRL